MPNPQRIEVATQADLDRVLAEGNRPVLLGDGWFRIGGSAHVEARESAHVEARESAHVVAWGSAHVVAWGSAHVEAWGSAHVVAWGSAHVEARGSAHVVARESAHVEAWGSAHVEARESAHVVAWGSAHVEAWGSAHVVARESAHVEASQYVAIHQHSETAQITGGVLIKVPKPTTPLDWCMFYGARIEGEVAILYKGVRDDYRSAHGMLYAPGTMPEAPDWDDGKKECGGGLHFTADPMTGKIQFDPDATRFVACPVALRDIIVHPNPEYPFKVKARRVAAPIYEVDQYGTRVNGNG